MSQNSSHMGLLDLPWLVQYQKIGRMEVGKCYKNSCEHKKRGRHFAHPAELSFDNLIDTILVFKV